MKFIHTNINYFLCDLAFCFLNDVCVCVCMMLRIEPREPSLIMLGKCSTTKLHSQSCHIF
jgi:hypothetical protein